MASKVVDIRSHSFADTDSLIFDANIWILLYGPGEPGDWRVQVYSEAFVQILNARSRIHVDALLMSEFVNRYARFEHDLLKGTMPSVSHDFKTFRNTPEFVPIASTISVVSKKVIGHCRRIESNFADTPVEALLDDFGRGGRDFNDQLIGELCRAKGHLLITDDGDFSSPGMTVITANKKLLGR